MLSESPWDRSARMNGWQECDETMSPTVLHVGGYRFYFFSREEPRPHVHVQHATGEAKFWLDPRLELAQNYGLSPARIKRSMSIIEEHYDEIRSAWAKHFVR